MSEPLVLAIDQGTTNSKALLVAPDGSVRLARSRAMRMQHPRPGWAEQSALAIWDAVAGLAAEVAETVGPGEAIAALAISNQRETIVLWDAATGEPLAPAISWQCRRSAERCAAMRAAGHEADIVRLSGLGLDPLFPAAKIAWLLDSIPGARARARRGEIRCGTIDSWLLWKFSDGAVHATEPGNASRTQLFNLDTLAFDPLLARLFDVPLEMLPAVLPSDSRIAVVAAGISPTLDGVPIHAVMGDSHAAMFAHHMRGAGAKVTMGTGSSLMALTAGRVRSAHGLSGTIAWSRGTVAQHALEGNIMVSGRAVSFVADLLGLDDPAMVTTLAESVEDSNGVVFVPALAGLGAPHWCADARGEITGLTLGATSAHIARATLEAVALQIADVLAALNADLGGAITELHVDGGAVRNRLLVQLLADLADCIIFQPGVAEVSALGAARMAQEALGIRAEAPGAPAVLRIVPAMTAEARHAILGRWRRALSCAVHGAAVVAANKDGTATNFDPAPKGGLPGREHGNEGEFGS